MVLKIEKDHQRFRQAPIVRAMRALLFCLCFAGISPCAFATPEEDVSAAKKVYEEFTSAVRASNRDQAIKLAYVPREYLRPLVNGWLDVYLENDRLWASVEKKIRPLNFNERFLMEIGPTKVRDSELTFRAMDTPDIHKPVIAELKITAMSPMASPIAWIMPTSMGYRVNILYPFDPSGEIPEQIDDGMKNVIEPQIRVLPGAALRLSALRARVEAGEFDSVEKVSRAISETSGQAEQSATMPSSAASN